MSALSGNSQTTFITTGKKREQRYVFCLFFMTVSSVIKYSLTILCDPLCLSDNCYEAFKKIIILHS